MATKSSRGKGGKPPVPRKKTAMEPADKLAPIGPPPCSHRGEAVKVGQYKVLAGGTRYLTGADLAKADVLIPLGEGVPRLEAPPVLGEVSHFTIEVWGCPWRDMSPPPEGFGDFLREQVIPALEAGRRILAYCIGSHGRTGSFLASLIAMLEPETVDPIAAVRERHCRKAVETRLQAEAIFALRDEKLPACYEAEFYRPPVQPLLGLASGFGGAGQYGSAPRTRAWESYDK